MDCYEEGDALHGAKIYAEARKMQGLMVIVKGRQTQGAEHHTDRECRSGNHPEAEMDARRVCLGKKSRP